MARPVISELESRRILALPKAVRGNIQWKRKANEAWFEAQVGVSGDFHGRVELIATVNAETPSRYGFSLLMNGAHRISGLDVNGSHRNT